MTDRSKQLAGALSADVTCMVKERHPDELARAQFVHARSEKLVLGFMVSSVVLWFLGPAMFLNGLIGPAIAIAVPGLLTLGFLMIVLVAIIQNRAASQPIVEYAKELGHNVTSVTKKGITVSVPKGVVNVPEEFRETRKVTRQR
ncbi:hypothetical protein [Paenarthrobacter nitroguajacolicus]|uniref:hypothetical protein n=1 Tax=Paenarthrobacter nitroguajacolicus TaxID=211146 RepID=UPI0015C174CA|nr:hypothetical protein [Paenarthrobacter nitroguajacolicus]NWL34948.1 hypothetical protein [Paenarthrobacter nitroguajacolicus]